MNMSGDIRVRTDRKYKTLYKEMSNCAVREAHELFFICACLGFRHGKRKPLQKQGEDRFWSSTITPEEYASYYSIIVESEEMNYSAVLDDKEVISKIEEYANAGMGILLEEILADYTIESGNEFRLDRSCSDELPKVLLAYLFNTAGE